MSGNRFSLPNASIMLNQPRSRARGQASDIAIKAQEIINNRKVTNSFLVCAISHLKKQWSMVSLIKYCIRKNSEYKHLNLLISFNKFDFIAFY